MIRPRIDLILQRVANKEDPDLPIAITFVGSIYREN